jgi:hypothetical protein
MGTYRIARINPGKFNLFFLALIVILILETFVGEAPVFAADTSPFIKWIAPISTESTYLAADQSFTASWEISSQGGGGVSSSGTVMYSNSSASSSGSCGTYSSPSQYRSGIDSITISNNHCYRWTFDPAVSAGASKPINSSGVASTGNLTVELKIFDQSCALSTLSGVSSGLISVEFSDSRTVGYDCASVFRVPLGISSINYLVVGGGGAGGYGNPASQGGGGPGGGGGDVKQSTASASGNVTPGRTYEIQVGAGARPGTVSPTNITCTHGSVSSASLTTTDKRGGDSFIRQVGLSARNDGGVWGLGGACAKDGTTGGVGYNGGLNGNGVNGGRGGNDSYKNSGTVTVAGVTKTCSSANPCGVAGFEGSGGGGGANSLLLGHYTNCRPDSTYHAPWPSSGSSPWASCDAWDIDSIGGIGGAGGDGSQVSWYGGSASILCSSTYGGGGGGGGSTPSGGGGQKSVPGFGTDGSNSSTNYIYSWSGSTYTYETYTANNSSLGYWTPVGGPGGKGGGGSAATSPYNYSASGPSSGWSYNLAISGTDKCGGGGGGGISGTNNATGVSNATAARTPGAGGNGVVAIQFSYDSTVTNSGLDVDNNPNFTAPQGLPIAPNMTSLSLPIKISQKTGSGYLCIDIEDPTTHNSTSSAYSSSTNIQITSSRSSGATLEESGTVSTLSPLASQLKLSTTSNRWSSNIFSSYFLNKKLYLRVRYAGLDIFSKFTCTTNFPPENSTYPDLASIKSLKQIVAINEITLKQIRQISIKNFGNGNK